MTVQPGVRARPRGAPLRAAVPEPQDQDPLLWPWPGAQVAAELLTPPGDAAKGRHGNPCPEAPGDRYHRLFQAVGLWVCIEETDRSGWFPRAPAESGCCLHRAQPFVPTVERADEWKEMAVFSF